MISLSRKNVLELKTLKYVLFKYIPVKVNLELPAKFVKKDILNINEITNEIKNNYIENILVNHQYESSKISDLIDNYFSKNYKNKTIIEKEIYENTFLDNYCRHWNITNLVRKYNITGKEVFTYLSYNNIPFGMGCYSYEKQKNNLQEISKYWNECSKYNDNFINVDYFNGILIKNSFPKDIYQENFILNIRNSFENNAVSKILTLLNDKIEIRSPVLEKFDKYEEKIKEPKIKINEKVFDIPFEESNIKTQGYFNHRLFNDKVWDFMLFSDESDYKNFVLEGIKNNVFDLKNYFTIIKNKLVPFENTKLENISIVNCLIFGKTRIRVEDIDKLMGLVRYKSDRDLYYLDNYVLDYNNKKDNRNYLITINEEDKELNKLMFYTDDETKYTIAKYIIQIMNEVKPELLNHHNYNVLVNYLRKNVVGEYRLWRLVPEEKNRIKRIKFE